MIGFNNQHPGKLLSQNSNSEKQNMEPEEHQSLHAIVEGHVQGVGFRFFVQDLAERRALTGWVRNREERQVEVYAEGSHADLSRLLDALYQGPGGAVVTRVDFEWSAALGKHSRFSIVHSEQ